MKLQPYSQLNKKEFFAFFARKVFSDERKKHN